MLLKKDKQQDEDEWQINNYSKKNNKKIMKEKERRIRIREELNQFNYNLK